MNSNGVDPNKHPGCVTASFIFIGICNVMGLVFLLSGMDADRFLFCGLAFFFSLFADIALVYGFFKDFKINRKKAIYYDKLYDEQEAARKRREEQEGKEEDSR